MFQKFALAFKTKTIEFFADDEDDDAGGGDDGDDLVGAPTTPDAVITGQRVVVLKPDLPLKNTSPSGAAAAGDSNAAGGVDDGTLVAAVFATVASFHAAYLHLQAAHSPFLPTAAAEADAAAVSHLRRLSDLKRLPVNPNPSPNSITSHLQAQVRENQALLRAFDAVVNRLQGALDVKDSVAADLRRDLAALEADNARLAARLDRALAPPPGAGDGDAVAAMLSAGVFDSVLRDALRAAHRFTRAALAELSLRPAAAAEAAYPGVNYAKPGHCQYAMSSLVCLGMFDGFDAYKFSCEIDNGAADEIDVSLRRNESLRQFIEHSSADPLDLINISPECDFAQFCDRKYTQLFGNLDRRDSVVGSVGAPLYELFVAMASSIWTLHRLAWAYDPAVGIFQVGRGTEFSAVYMENVVRGNGGLMSSELRKAPRSKVAFTVVPGFRVGGTVIQCRVYLDCGKQAL